MQPKAECLQLGSKLRTPFFQSSNDWLTYPENSVASYFRPGGDRLRRVADMMLASLPQQLAVEVKPPMDARMICWQIQQCKNSSGHRNVVEVCNGVVETETPDGLRRILPPALKNLKPEIPDKPPAESSLTS